MKDLREVFRGMRKKKMPKTAEMAQRAQKAFEKSEGKNIFKPAKLKKDFDSVLKRLLDLEYRLYLDVQKEVNVKILKDHFGATIPASEKSFNALDIFYMGLQQSRKTRAGSSFEYHVRFLFKKLKYPFDEQEEINGTPDFVIPSADLYQRIPSECIIFTAKRTLRERWRQITIEGTRSQLFLATIDERVSENSLNELKRNAIYLVVPEAIYNTKEYYKSALNVITFSDFFLSYLDPAMVRWKRSGHIPL